MRVSRNTDDAPIGMCGLIKRVGLDDVDIGFAFLARYRSQGFALEAARAALSHGRDVLKLKRVVGITLPANTASITLLEKIGLAFESQVKLADDAETLSLYAIDFKMNQR